MRNRMKYLITLLSVLMIACIGCYGNLGKKILVVGMTATVNR